MKKIYLLFPVLVFACSTFNFCLAQNPQLIGMTYGGGAYSGGTIFKMNGDGSGFQTIYSFDTITGMNPYGTLLQANDGKLYGMTFYGGAHYYGTIFRFDPASYIYKDLYDFNLTDGASPYGSLIQATNGKLYGMAYGGGANSDGVLFSFNINDSTYNKLFDLTDSLGAFPKGDLMQASDGKMYGMTSTEGANYNGTLFSFDPMTNTFSKKVDFGSSNGVNPYGSLVETNNGKLYGTTRFGGANSAGVLFSFNPADSSYSKLLDFAGGNETSPSSGLALANNGRFYGMTLQGGLDNVGEVYSFDTLGNIYSDVQDFDSTNGSSPQFNTLMQASNGNLYGMTFYGGANNDGVVFSFDPSDSTYAKLVDFAGGNGKNPDGTLIELQTPTGILNEDNNVGIMIYPNPAGNELIIKNAELRIEKIAIYNLLGERVAFKQSEIVNPKSEIQINVSSLSAGIYFIEAGNDNNKWMGRFVKE